MGPSLFCPTSIDSSILVDCSQDTGECVSGIVLGLVRGLEAEPVGGGGWEPVDLEGNVDGGRPVWAHARLLHPD